MKTKVFGIILFALTAAAIVLIPLRHGPGATQQPVVVQPTTLQPAMRTDAARIEVVFVLDTTGSMSGLIEAAKEKIWSIATSLAQAESSPEIRMGLVAFRDRGDAYVTRVTGLSSDLDSIYATLMDYQAAGGGDTPESVNQALHDAVHKIGWSDNQDTYQAVFLVGDAPPHMDYRDEPRYPQIVAEAKQHGIVINTIQAGAADATRREWQKITALGAGDYFQVDQSGNAVAIATPYDEKLATLSEQLDATRLYYGDAETRAEKEGKLAATRKLHSAASVESRARRATFNASDSGKANLIGEDELIEDVASGRVELDRIETEHLPAEIQAMAPAAAKALIAEKAERRRRLQAEIGRLSQQRSDYLKQKVEESGGAEASLDDRIYGAVREQAAAKGFKYDTDAPAY